MSDTNNAKPTNASEMQDVQSSHDHRAIAIDKVRALFTASAVPLSAVADVSVEQMQVGPEQFDLLHDPRGRAPGCVNAYLGSSPLAVRRQGNSGISRRSPEKHVAADRRARGGAGLCTDDKVEAVTGR